MSERRRRPPRLQAVSAAVNFIIAFSAIIACGSLVLFTTRMHSASDSIRACMARVRLAQDVVLDLVADAHTTSRPERARLEADVSEKLGDLRVPSGASAMQADISGLATDAAGYVSARGAGAPEARLDGLLRAAGDSLTRFVRRNVELADAAKDRVVGLDQVSNLVGATAGVVMLALLGLSLWWTRRLVIRPIIDLSLSMERFAAGGFDVRADERGADEVCRTAERFNQMASSLARHHRARVSYLAGIAHDLRNPLAALQVSVAGLNPESTLPSATRMRQVIILVQRQVTRLNRMVDDLLDAARIDAGELDIRPQIGDLRPIVEDVAALFEGTSPVHVIQTRLPEHAVWARCDTIRVEQVLTNLVSNAIKYSPMGGAIRIAAWREGGWAIMSVSDDGRGMTPEEVKQIWEPFQRAGASHAVPGVGLGLWIVRRIVEAHGGIITVESTPDQGSTFRVALPSALEQSRVDPMDREGAGTARL